MDKKQNKTLILLNTHTNRHPDEALYFFIDTDQVDSFVDALETEWYDVEDPFKLYADHGVKPEDFMLYDEKDYKKSANQVSQVIEIMMHEKGGIKDISYLKFKNESTRLNEGYYSDYSVDLSEIRTVFIDLLNEYSKLLGYNNFDDLKEHIQLIDDGAIFYMNANDGTSFDFTANDRLCEFYVFVEETDRGAAKLLVEKDGGITFYGYDPLNPSTVIMDRYNRGVFSQDEVYEFAEYLQGSLDDKGLYDVNMDNHGWFLDYRGYIPVEGEDDEEEYYYDEDEDGYPYHGRYDFDDLEESTKKDTPQLDKLEANNIEGNYIVGISAFRDSETLDANKANNAELESTIQNDIAVKDYIGPNLSKWEGGSEEGFLLFGNNLKALKIMGIEQRAKYNQDSVIIWKAPIEYQINAEAPMLTMIDDEPVEITSEPFLVITKDTKLDEAAHKKCVLCKGPIEGYGNNPYPLADTGEACDKCNLEKVIPARIKALKNEATSKDNKVRLDIVPMIDRMAEEAGYNNIDYGALTRIQRRLKYELIKAGYKLEQDELSTFIMVKPEDKGDVETIAFEIVYEIMNNINRNKKTLPKYSKRAGGFTGVKKTR